MTTTNSTDARMRQRFSVDLKATGSLEGNPAELQLRVSNVSATGARLHADTKLDVRAGMRIRLKIFVPNTVLHIPTTAEIMWATPQGSSVSFGVRFADMVSAYMIGQLTRNSSPITA